MFLTAFFHIYGLEEVCLTDSCKPFHFCGISRTRLKLMQILACLPVLGQIIGYYMVKKGLNFFKEVLNDSSQAYYFHRIEYSSMIVRGVLTFLGLGIICLLIDCIVSCETNRRRNHGCCCF